MNDQLSDAAIETLRPFLRTFQIIVGALAFGVVLMATVALLIGVDLKPGDGSFIQPDGEIVRPEPKFPLIGMVATVFAFSGIAASTIVGQVMRSTSPAAPTDEQIIAKTPESQNYLTQLQTTGIVTAALLEGPALLTVVAVMIGEPIWVLGVTAVLLILLLLKVPSMDWLEQRILADRRRDDFTDGDAAQAGVA